MLLINPSSEPEAIAFTMDQLHARYQQTNNPIYPMFAFRHCFERHAQPPQWALEYVAVSFHDYLSNSGNKPIGECMQLNVGKGGTLPLKLFLIEERDEGIMWDMFRLVELLGYSMEKAAHMVKAKLELLDWSKTGIDLTEISEGSIRDMYRKDYRKKFKELVDHDGSLGRFSSEDKKKSFLASFPAYSFPVE